MFENIGKYWLLIFCLYSFPLIAQDNLDSLWILSEEVEEVVVSGQFLPIGQSEAISPVEIIDRATIEQRAALNLEELLKQSLSMRFTQDAVLGGQLQMQGLGGQYIKVLVDGVPMIGRSDGNLDLGRISLQNVDRVEIIEGPMSTVYGSNALGGTINIITKKYQQATLEGEWSAMAESVGRYNAYAALGAKWKRLTLRGNYSFNDFNGYSTDTLRSHTWNPKRQHIWDGLLRWDIGNDFSLKYTFRALDERINDLGDIRLAAFPELAYANDFKFLTRTFDHNLGFSGYLKDQRYFLEGFVAYNSYRREKNAYFQTLLENPEPTRQDSLNSDTSHFDAWHLRASLASEHRKKFDFQAGLDLRYEQGSGARIQLAEDIEKPVSIGDYALFANLRYFPIKKLQLQLGGRYAYNTRYIAPITFNAQLKWDFAKAFSLRASYARGFRAPELKELYLDFVDSNHFIKGNSDLKAERSHHARLSLHYHKKLEKKQRLELSLTGFYNLIQDQIALRDYALDSLGNYIPSTTTTNLFTYFNINQFQSLGADSRLSYQVGNFTLRLGVILTGRFNALNADFKSVPAFSYTLEFNEEISYQLPKWGWTFSLFRKDYDKLLRYSTSFDPIEREEIVVQNQTGAYALLDLTISKTFLNKNFRFTAGIRNILNVVNVPTSGNSGTHTSVGELSVGTGRSFFVQAVYRFHIPNKKGD